MDPQNGHYLATAGADAQVKIFDLRTYKEVHSYFSAAPAVALDISQRGMLAVTYGNRVQIWNSSAIRGPKASSPYLNHATPNGSIVADARFCPYDDALGVGHALGFSNVIVPGAGEPNYDSMVANPFETRNQRREQEVAQLMDKLDPETIQLDGDAVGEGARGAEGSAARAPRGGGVGGAREEGEGTGEERGEVPHEGQEQGVEAVPQEAAERRGRQEATRRIC